MPKNKPASDHPWKQPYKKNLTKESKRRVISKNEKFSRKSLNEFLTEILEVWDKVEINMDAFGHFGRYTLGTLGDKKAAEWLVDMLERHYVDPS